MQPLLSTNTDGTVSTAHVDQRPEHTAYKVHMTWKTQDLARLSCPYIFSRLNDKGA